ncbi:response regulator [Marivirga arenosa]|uniref:Response regulator n=1 Tax=Marivirga arenosa TaxID=3059076 RepID=A0AA49GH30_9BACT|nr:response regulator [Marivirga sp. BKB1-2]WKK81931.1 response regulator [Marivirga sp. BKB1-2]
MNAKPKVLYVDDEELNLLIFEKLLEDDYEVIKAESGEEALEILEKQSDIVNIITDLNMPLMSGLEFINEAKSRFENKKYYVLTGYAINDEMQEALDSKLIIQFWTKPAEFDKIDKALKEN